MLLCTDDFIFCNIQYNNNMPILLLQFQDADISDEDALVWCPYCGSTQVQRWGQFPRSISDTKPIDAMVIRYFCENCEHTFRFYPKGVDRSSYSQRIRRLAALIWVLELSCRDVVEVFDEFGISLNRMTVWREGQKLVDHLNNQKAIDFTKRFTIDKSIGLENRPKHGVVLAISLIPEKFSILGTLNTDDPKAVRSWLEPILEDLDIDVSVLDTHEFVNGGPCK
jgi:transposase-like protein